MIVVLGIAAFVAFASGRFALSAALALFALIYVTGLQQRDARRDRRLRP